MGRTDYYHDPGAPAANSLVPGGSAIIVNEAGEVLLQRRSDNDRWALPSGTMDIGETIGEAVVREVREETGIEAELIGILGVYSDPGHVFAYDDGEVRQQFNICFTGRAIGGKPRPSDESSEVRFFPLSKVEDLNMHESIRLRLRHYSENRPQAVIA